MDEPIFDRIAYLQQRRKAAVHTVDTTSKDLRPMAKERLQEIDQEMEQLKTMAAPIIRAEPDPLLRKILTLRYLEGRPVSEISGMTHYAAPTIFKMLHRWGERIDKGIEHR